MERTRILLLLVVTLIIVILYESSAAYALHIESLTSGIVYRLSYVPTTTTVERNLLLFPRSDSRDLANLPLEATSYWEHNMVPILAHLILLLALRVNASKLISLFIVFHIFSSFSVIYLP